MDHDSIHSDEDDNAYVDRRALFTPVVQSLVSALGGVENGAYRPGDDCHGCLKDLKKLWRRDDTDDDRTVARLFYEARVLPNDLIPILTTTTPEDRRALAAADLVCAMTWPIDLAEELKELDDEIDARADYTQLLRAHREYKHALLRPGVLQSIFALALPCLARAPKDRTPRDAQVVNLVLHVVRNLAFIRDPPLDSVRASADAVSYAALQGTLVRTLAEARILDFLITVAANAVDDSRFNAWNVVVLEILYLIFRGVDPSELAMDQAQQPAKKLHSLLAVEGQRRLEHARTMSSRHGRFGTTIAVSLRAPKGTSTPSSLDPTVHDIGAPDDDVGSAKQRPVVIHRQRGITQGAGDVLDLTSGKRTKARRILKADELGALDAGGSALGLEARTALAAFARTMLSAGFNPLLASLLKDIKYERPKIGEKDHLRLLCLTGWFMAFFRHTRAAKGGEEIPFGALADVTERGWIVWVLRRMREAMEVKPKAWNELQAGIRCVTELVLLIEAMGAAASSTSSSVKPIAGADNPEILAETADILQQQLVYNGEVLDLALDALRAYRPGTQSLAYLDGAVHLAWALLRVLEKWTKGSVGKEMVVRRKARAKKKKATGQSTEEGDGVPDVPDEEEEALARADEEREEERREAVFTFEAFEMRFANAEVAQTLLAYLARYREFGNTHEKMKRVVGLLHRQAVRAKAEGLFFNVSTLDLFKSILTEQKSFPQDQSYKDLLALINFLLRKFFKAAEGEPFLLIEAFFPKNRGLWKAYSSLDPEDERLKKGKGKEVGKMMPAEVKVKKGHSWSEQVGIAVRALQEGENEELVVWTKDLLMMAYGQRQRIVDEVDGIRDEPPAEAEEEVDGDIQVEDAELEAKRRLDGPSDDAREKFEDYFIPYITDEQEDTATSNVYLKLLFRLLNFEVAEEGAEKLQWFIPKTIAPAELQRCFNIIIQFLKNPIDLDDKKAKDMLSKTRRRRIRSPSPSSDTNATGSDAAEWDAILGVGSTSEERKARKAMHKAKKQQEREARTTSRKERKKKEEQEYKSAQFIEDSDAELGDDEAFFARERALRQRMAAASAQGAVAPTMRASGTKKRRKGPEEGGRKIKKRKGTASIAITATAVRESEDEPAQETDSDAESDEDAGMRGAAPVDVAEASAPRSRPKPRPRRRQARAASEQPSEVADDALLSDAPGPLSSDAEDDARDIIAERAAPRRRGRLVLSDDEES